MKKHFHIHIGGVHRDSLHKGRTSSVFARLGKDAYVDWVGILTISTILTLALVGFGVVLFMSIDKGSGAGTAQAPVTKPLSLDTSDMEKLIALFRNKSDSTVSFSKSYNGPQDPSTPSASK